MPLEGTASEVHVDGWLVRGEGELRIMNARGWAVGNAVAEQILHELNID